MQRVEKAIDKNNTSIIKYSKTDNVLNDICTIIDSAKDYAFQSVNLALVERNWLIWYRIAEEELGMHKAESEDIVRVEMTGEKKKWVKAWCH